MYKSKIKEITTATDKTINKKVTKNKTCKLGIYFVYCRIKTNILKLINYL